MARTRSQRPVTRRANRSLCRIGLRGDLAFVDRATSAVAGSGIEVARIEQPGKKVSPKASAAQGIDALVASISSEADGDSEARRLCEELPELPIVVVVDAIGESTARTMLRAGVRGIVLGGELEEALAPAVRATQVGQISIPRSGRRQVFRPVLSHRENTVLAMVALGRSNTQIADSLNLEESTVKSHLGSLFAKLGVRSREEAAAAVFDGDSQIASGVLAVTDQQPHPEKPKSKRRAKPSGKRLVS